MIENGVQKFLQESRSAYYMHLNTCQTCKKAPYLQGTVGLPKKDRKELCPDGQRLLKAYESAVDAADEHALWESGKSSPR